MLPASEPGLPRPRVAVIGGSGYVGAELCRLLAIHPVVELAAVVARGQSGRPLHELHPHLPRSSLCICEPSIAALANDVDAIMLAVPHGHSAPLVAELGDAPVRVIDLGADFRLPDPAVYADAHGRPHPCRDRIAEFVYGLPELSRSAIASARRVASPGCFATAIVLAMMPLCAAGWVDAPTHHVGATGSSGAGALPGPRTHHPERAGNLLPYRPLTHPHAAEIDQVLSRIAARRGHAPPPSVRFVPIAAPLSRGILATSFVELPGEADSETVAIAMREAYEPAPFVRLRRDMPEVARVKGAMWADLGWVVGAPDPASGRRPAAFSVALDNLLKGGAGQAVQSLNLMLGLSETTGLDAPAPWP